MPAFGDWPRNLENSVEDKCLLKQAIRDIAIRPVPLRLHNPLNVDFVQETPKGNATSPENIEKESLSNLRIDFKYELQIKGY